MSIPGAGNPLLLGGAAGGYEIERSLRFNSADSAYLSRTPASAGNRKTWTWAGWVKRSGLANQQVIFAHYGGTFNQNQIRFTVDDRLEYFIYTGSYPAQKLTTQVFRDTSSWYHFVFTWDTSNATASDRMRIYVNGVRISSFSASVDPSLNLDSLINNAVPHAIHNASATFFNGYSADIHFIDGQALDPSSFGEFDTNGIWQPKAFSGGSYGTNGFHLDFADNSTAAALGYDAAGSNDWTVNNLSVAAGAGNDSLVDSPTNYGTDTGAGGEVRGNYCTWNPADKNTNVTLANGNLDMSQSASGAVRGTIGVSSGKWYWEVVAGSGNTVIGVTDGASALGTYVGSSPKSVGWAQADLFFVNGVTGVGTGDPGPYTAGDTIGVALNMDAGTVQFYKNNTLCPRSASGLTGTWFPAIGTNVSATTSVANFGQRQWAHTPPAGFKALCTTNLPEPTIADPSTVMDVVTYTGNGSTQTISGLGFSPDLVWIKSRSNTQSNQLFDNVRGAGIALKSDETSAEITNNAYGYLSAFSSNGFDVSTGSTAADLVNKLNWTYAAWAWDAGSSTVTNTQGSITSQVRANASAGFSIVTLTYSSSGTVGHGLGVAPAFIIKKNRGSVAAGYENWHCYHSSLGDLGYIMLNSTAAAGSAGFGWGANSTTFNANAAYFSSGTFVCYCFAPVAGYSSFGSYTGNGSTDGPFVFCNFRPAFVLVKGTSTGYIWTIEDSKRDTYNGTSKYLQPQSSDAEGSVSAPHYDFTSNGFKIRTTDSAWNQNGTTYIYAAFAESPFQYARAR